MTITAGSEEKTPTSARRGELADHGDGRHQADGQPERGEQRLADPIEAAGADVLAGDGRRREGQRDDRQEERLHQAQADAEAGLGRRSERPRHHAAR